MGLDLTGLPTENIKRAGAILCAAGISDEKAVAALDIVGAMLRERKLMTAGEVEFSVDDAVGHYPTVFVTFPLHVGANAVSEMTYELCEKLLEKYPDHSPSLNIGFRSAGAL